MAQLLRIAVIGPKQCPNCDEVLAALGGSGLVAEKHIFDPDMHGEYVEMAKRENLTEMPILCTIGENDQLTYMGAGRSPFMRTRLIVVEKRLQAAAISV